MLELLLWWLLLLWLIVFNLAECWTSYTLLQATPDWVLLSMSWKKRFCCCFVFVCVNVTLTVDVQCVHVFTKCIYSADQAVGLALWNSNLQYGDLRPRSQFREISLQVKSFASYGTVDMRLAWGKVVFSDRKNNMCGSTLHWPCMCRWEWKHGETVWRSSVCS